MNKFNGVIMSKVTPPTIKYDGRGISPKIQNNNDMTKCSLYDAVVGVFVIL
jgi:hypothetical protein